MKRIIIPAGTISGKRDYILEIPMSSNAQDNEEDSIYILDDKCSMSSSKSLSDYFYDTSENYPEEYHVPQPAVNYNNGCEYSSELNNAYQKRKSIEQRCSSSNYALQHKYAQNKYPPILQTASPKISEKDQAKYNYYKSLGFSDSELYRLMANKSTTKNRSKNLPRKYMKFSRFGVSDFLSPSPAQSTVQYGMDIGANPNNIVSQNSNIDTYDNMSYTQIANPSSYSYNLNQQQPNSAHRRVYSSNYGHVKEKPTPVQSATSRTYQQYNSQNRSTMQSRGSFRAKSPITANYMCSRTHPSNIASNHVLQTSPNDRKNLQVSGETKYYPKTAISCTDPSNKRVVYQNWSNKPASSGISGQPSNYQNIRQQSNLRKNYDEVAYYPYKQAEVKEHNGVDQRVSKAAFKTLPGTSMVSSSPSVHLKKINQKTRE